jgi:hypothetical protein
MGGTVFLDIETRELVPENRDLSLMRISIAGVRKDGEAFIFTEEDIAGLFTILDDADLIVGHNLILFDYKVLNRYAGYNVAAKHKERTLDFFYAIMQMTDRRVSMNDLAQRNLGIAKLGEGKDAPVMYKEGRMDELRAYLEQDLLILERLYDHLLQHGRLKYGHIVYKEPVEREIELPIKARPKNPSP